MKGSPSESLKENICSVKPPQLSLALEFPEGAKPLQKAMIHHKVIYRNRYNKEYKPYGVSSSHRVLSPQLLFKKFYCIRDCLEHVIGLTPGQRETMLRLLRLWAYYGKVYPKQSQVSIEPGCSKATYWRTIHILEELGLVQVINRYIIRPRAQISNLYRFDKLLIILARYLAEHGVQFWEKWLKPYLTMPGFQFWSSFWDNLTLGFGSPPLNDI